MSSLVGWILFGLMCILVMLAPEHTPERNASTSLDVWMQGCKPGDIHTGSTEDERGTRAFIVTCSPGGAR